MTPREKTAKEDEAAPDRPAHANGNGRLGAVGELVRAIGGLPILVLSILLLFPSFTAGFLLWRTDQTLNRLAKSIEERNELVTQQAQRTNDINDSVKSLVNVILMERKHKEGG